MKHIATWPMGVGVMEEFSDGYVLHAGDPAQCKYLTRDSQPADDALADRLHAACWNTGSTEGVE